MRLIGPTPIAILAGLVLAASCADPGGTAIVSTACAEWAEAVCARRAACGLVSQEAAADCVADLDASCSGDFCPLHEVPSADSLAACAAAIVAGDCAAAGASAICGDLACVPGPTRAYFTDYPPYDIPSCSPGATPAHIGGTVALRLFRGPGVSDGQLRSYSRGVQRFYEPYELLFYSEQPPTAVATRAVMTGTLAQLEAALVNAGIDPNEVPTGADLEKARQIMGDIIFAPLHAFMATYGQDPGAPMNFAVVPRIADDELAQSLLPGAEIAGLGISPALLARLAAEEESDELYSLLGLEPTFTPTVFIGRDAIEKLGFLPDIVCAHEVGHALGLPHVVTGDNVMKQGLEDDCVPVLSDAQVARLDGVRYAALLAQDPRPLRRLLDAFDRLVERLFPLRSGRDGD